MATRPVRSPHRRQLRRMPFGAPSRYWALSEWALVPLRAFLGVTFLVAGIQKIANPDFFSWSSPSGIHAQMQGAARTSPVSSLLTHLLGASSTLGWFIALCEVAIGVGTILGLWTRAAAVGGAVLSLTLFLTISWNSSPYYTGADIVFLFAWMPLIIAGGGGRLSLDGRIQRAAAREGSAPEADIVAVPFAQIQSLCGNYQHGKCRAQSGRACSPNGCPVLEGTRPSLPARAAVDDVDRRTLVKGGAAAGVIAAGSLILVGAAGALGRALHSSAHSIRRPNSSTTTTSTTPSQTTTTAVGTPSTTTTAGPTPSGTRVALASQVSVGSAASITIPATGDPGVLICTSANQFVCYDAICPHAGCQVGYSPAANLIVCPCHGSQFDVSTGNVIAGPAPMGLTPFTVTEGPGGGLYI